MYYPYFLTYILTGIGIGTVVFIWALKTGQFTEQQRARFLALEDEPLQPAAVSLKGRFEFFCLFFLAIAAIVASIALIGYVLFFH